MKQILTALACAAFLTGCPTAPTSQQQSPAAPSAQNLTPQAAVFAAKGGYEVALTVAVAYAELPRCAPRTEPLCSKQPVVDHLVRARNVARDAITAAEQTVRTPEFGADITASAVTAAQAALQAFVSITNTLKVKP